MQVMVSANKFTYMLTIVDVVAADLNLTTLLKGIQAAGLETELAKSGPFTVFGPSEMAFGKLANGVLPNLLQPENKGKLTELMQQHFVTGKSNFKDFKDGQILKTIGGKDLKVAVSGMGEVTINGSKIQGRDSEATNGVVYSMDKVIAAN
jgi:uncharacterized surface protein with fasciclin (FAS1) repeats